jgi:hypothetical protein
MILPLILTAVITLLTWGVVGLVCLLIFEFIMPGKGGARPWGIFLAGPIVWAMWYADRRARRND